MQKRSPDLFFNGWFYTILVLCILIWAGIGFAVYKVGAHFEVW